MCHTSLKIMKKVNASDVSVSSTSIIAFNYAMKYFDIPYRHES